jgi:hypothetical protein
MDKRGYDLITEILGTSTAEADGLEVAITPPVGQLDDRPTKSVRFVDLSFDPGTSVACVKNLLNDGEVLHTQQRTAKAVGPLLRATGDLIIDGDHLTITFEDLNDGVVAEPTLGEIAASNSLAAGATEPVLEPSTTSA